MRPIKEILNVMAGDHAFSQKLNYLKCVFSKRAEVLNYDPVAISIVATTRCTLACDMCPTHSRLVPKEYEHRQRSFKDMDLEMFKYIIDRFANALGVNIIGSGEPLLNKDFFEMVDYAASKKMVVKTFSNGTTIEENIDRILNSKLDGITISLNGHDPAEFRRMTGMDESIYPKIYAAIGRLIAEKKERGSKVKVKLSFIVDRQNYRFIPDMIDTSLELGADYVFFCNFLPAPYGGLEAAERMLFRDDRVIDDIKGMVKKYPPSVFKKIALPPLVDKDLDENLCDTHFSQVRFDGDGNVSSCSMMLLDMTGKGNYKDQDVWNNDFFRSMRRRFLANDKKELFSPCLSCPDNSGVYPWR